jgi:predicted RND superfamily exporter protein
MRASRWLLLALALAAFCYAGLSRISFDVSVLKLLPGNLRQVQGLGLFLKHFALPDELMVTLEAADSDTAETAATELAEHLRTRPDLARSVVERAPWEAGSPQMGEFLAFALLNQPPEKISALAARLAPETIAATLDESRTKLSESIDPQQIAMLGYDPLGLTALLDFQRFAQGSAQSEFASADGAFRVLYVTAAPKLRHYKDNIAWIAELRRVCEAWRGDRPMTLGFTGEPAFIADISGTMDWDMSTSGLVTLAVIAIIFWLCFRRLRPLLALQGMLVLIFLLALSTAGLLLADLTVMGVGFASIMIGLSVDYGYFVYQRSRTHTGSVAELRRQCVQNVMWTAGTTAAAFFALNVSSLPGLSQLGSLVGIGVVVGAFVMLFLFPPLALRFQEKAARPSVAERLFQSPRALRTAAWLVLALVLGSIGVLVVKGPPRFDFSANTLRPRVSPAYDALDRLQARLIDDSDALNLIVAGRDEDEVLSRLRTAESALTAAQERGQVGSFTTAAVLWPDAARQRANLATVQPLAADRPRLRQAVLDAGFNEEAFGLADSILAQWQQWREAAPPIWPTSDASRWLLRRAAHRGESDCLALGIVHPKPGDEPALRAAVETEGVYLTSWPQLGRELEAVIPAEIVRVVVALLVLIVALLWIAFRSLRDVLLFIACTALVFTMLAGAMSLFGLTWNLFNMAAALLLIGTGTDYSILLLLALRRNGGDILDAQRSLGLVIFLCGSSSAVGFATLGWANNIGLASLGLTCALGLACASLIALFLLPHARSWLHRGGGNFG